MAVILKCPDCEGKFRWEFGAKSKWPKTCPLCDARMGEERPDDDIVLPAFLSARTKANDEVYRQVERGSEQRAEEAARLAGCSVEDMSSLKVTNLQPTTHPGDIAIPRVSPENNAVAAAMATANARGGRFGFQGADGSSYSGSVQTGPEPNAGARMRSALHSHHSQISHGSAVSDRPALETLQPGYRRRA